MYSPYSPGRYTKNDGRALEIIRGAWSDRPDAEKRVKIITELLSGRDVQSVAESYCISQNILDSLHHEFIRTIRRRGGVALSLTFDEPGANNFFCDVSRRNDIHPRCCIRAATIFYERGVEGMEEALRQPTPKVGQQTKKLIKLALIGLKRGGASRVEEARVARQA